MKLMCPVTFGYNNLCYKEALLRYVLQGLSQDFHNKVSKLGFQEFRVSKIPD